MFRGRGISAPQIEEARKKTFACYASFRASRAQITISRRMARRRSVLREVRVGFDFQDLQSVPPSMAGNEQDPLIGVERANRRDGVVRGMIARVVRGGRPGV